MSSDTNTQSISVIRTFECELCLRFDSIMMPREELIEKVTNNSLNIGTHLISHGDHMRIIYFNIDEEYLGDVISLNMIKATDHLNSSSIPIFSGNSTGKIKNLRANLLKLLLKSKSELCIVGPSNAGKTSLSTLLDCGIPERYNGYTRRSPTLHKSTKHMNLGNHKLTIHDMGGQRDFWEGWKDAIPYSDKLIFMIDGAANNANECALALDLVLSSRIDDTPILVLINKYDLVLDGYSQSFTDDKMIIQNLKSNNLNNVWLLNTSVFNGVCYNYNGVQEEKPIQDVIVEFLDFHAIKQPNNITHQI